SDKDEEAGHGVLEIGCWRLEVGGWKWADSYWLLFPTREFAVSVGGQGRPLFRGQIIELEVAVAHGNQLRHIGRPRELWDPHPIAARFIIRKIPQGMPFARQI